MTLAVHSDESAGLETSSKAIGAYMAGLFINDIDVEHRKKARRNAKNFAVRNGSLSNRVRSRLWLVLSVVGTVK